MTFLKINNWLRFGLMSIIMTPQLALALTFTVEVSDNGFSPSNQTVKVGDSVRWVLEAGGEQHNVTANNDSFSSPTSDEFTYTHTFTETGNFGYRCTIHSASETGTINVQVADSTVDLEMASVDAENGAYFPGDDIRIDIFVVNNEAESSPSYTVSFYASTNSTVNSADTLLERATYSPIAGGDSRSSREFGTFPGGMQDGDYFIGAVIEINDTNNSNNRNVHPTKVRLMGTQPPPNSAELQLNEVGVLVGEYLQGANIAITSSVSNIGNLDSSAFSINYYASLNSSISVSDFLLGTQDRAALEIDGLSLETFETVIPEDLEAGTYFIGGIIDFDDGNNSNNVAVAEFPITVTEPELPFQINAGLNGNWWGGPERAGEGAAVEITKAENGDLGVVSTFYTYDPEGRQIFLIMVGPVTGETATLDVFITDNGVWGDFFDPALIEEDLWGTAIVTGIGCENITIELEPNEVHKALDYTTLSYDFIRLTEPAAPCPIESE